MYLVKVLKLKLKLIFYFIYSIIELQYPLNWYPYIDIVYIVIGLYLIGALEYISVTYIQI